MAAIEEMLGVTLGEFDEQGAIKADATHCAFTGRYTKGIHAVRERVSGTRYFYRVMADVYHKVDDDWRAAFAAQLVPAKPVATPKAERKVSEENANDKL